MFGPEFDSPLVHNGTWPVIVNYPSLGIFYWIRRYTRLNRIPNRKSEVRINIELTSEVDMLAIRINTYIKSSNTLKLGVHTSITGEYKLRSQARSGLESQVCNILNT